MSAPTFDSEQVYNAAAGGYAELSERLWPWTAAGLASRLRALPPATRVLDVGCGPGGVSLRIARLLGQRAHVTGVDISEEMLDRARENARSWGARNVTFRHGDMNDLSDTDLPAAADAVTAGLSLFLAPGISQTAAGLWERVRPGGRLTVSVVSEQFFTPAFDGLLEVMRDAGHGTPYIPWRRVDHPNTLRAALGEAGIDHVKIDVEIRQIPIEGPADWVSIMHGTGIRALLDDLDVDCRAAVQAASLQKLEALGLRSIAFGVLYAVADKPE